MQQRRLSSKSDEWFGPLHDIADEAYSQRHAGLRGEQRAWAHRSQWSSARAASMSTWHGEAEVRSRLRTTASPPRMLRGWQRLALSKHSGLTSFQVKTVLQTVADNGG